MTEGKRIDSGLDDTDQMHSALWRKSKTRWIATRRSSTSPHVEGVRV